MNPYTHHPSLAGSPHHAQGGPHHGYSTGGGGGGGGGGGNGTTTTPDPSPHSPPYGAQPDSNTPYSTLQSGQGLNSNGHHHGPGNMLGDQPHHQSHSHPHLSGHLPYPPVNHNNNCTLKQEAGHEGSVGIQPCAGCGCRIVDRHVYYALDRYWHNNCLKCTACGSLLADIGPSCYAKNQMILCKSDYRR
ncbi:LIM/homeobox protein Lhx3-like [Leptopilina boulardi]|uniref:LIM/homeobox protein Lhx3-like n=1 Tax=Leptopilina boulardi TaxID=63433 RepID=UPI0021F653BE|nr:LIM/homeobox protein Lhx3-like [Leptopilina boulardi]